MPTKEVIAEWFKQKQHEITKGLETIDGQGRFKEDLWDRPGGGGGRTRVIQGKLIEKGGVNFSEVHGTLTESSAKSLGIDPGDFYATGVSIVLHPQSPLQPIIHMNIRYFEVENGIWWFGGGIDLTPHYVTPKYAKLFHRKLKEVCDRADGSFYDKFKTWADNYFYIPHRKETRGVGGIFFDRLNESTGLSKADLWRFVQEVGDSFVPIYTEQTEPNRGKIHTEAHRRWQMLRRGRYTEFNLVWDKGTKFGLHTDGRTESILMSLPPTANWVYSFKADAGSDEEKTLKLLKKDINWVDYECE